MAFAIKFILVMLAMIVADVCWAMYFIEIDKRRVYAAGAWASIIIIASAFITTSYVEDKSMVPAAALGAFIGTAATVYYKKRKEMTVKDKITGAVIDDLVSRSQRGLNKYNTTLHENDHQNMLQHGYEEALDLAQYLKKEILTINTVQDLVAHYSNDAELGAKIREIYGEKQADGDRAEN